MKLTNTCGIGSTVHCVLAMDFRVLRLINRRLPAMLPEDINDIAPTILSYIALVICYGLNAWKYSPKLMRQSNLKLNFMSVITSFGLWHPRLCYIGMQLILVTKNCAKYINHRHRRLYVRVFRIPLIGLDGPNRFHKH